MPDGKHQGASYGRWYILGLICLMYLITYLDRVNISTATIWRSAWRTFPSPYS